MKEHVYVKLPSKSADDCENASYLCCVYCV